ncbi:hypothetical protein G9A89_005209 [Geosiphon pyriformis]|nr:hypothetical protein G9A89_005209 [Geosiphon pyriformis]
MSGLSAKRRSARVLTTGSVGGDLTQKVKKPLSGVKLSSTDKNLKDSGPVSVNRQLTSMDMDEEASDDKTTSDSQINTPNAKRFNTGMAISSLFSSINYDMDDKEEVSLPLYLSFSLEKVEVAVKKSFTLDINLSAVIRKLFSGINGFGGATTLSKFEGIIRSTFTLSESMEKAALLARDNNIIMNSDLKKQGIRSDWAIVIKEIPMDTPKEMIVAAISEFGKIESIKIQLIGLWQKTVSFLIGKDSVRVVKAVGDCNIWAFRDRFRALLFTLSVGTTVHDLSNLLNKTGGRTCIINCSLNTDNRVCCAVVGFKSENDLNSAFLTELDLVWCGKCGHLEHSALKCDASDMLSSDLLNNFNKRRAPGVNCLQLVKLYAKKNVLISCSAAFGGKLWAQVVSLASFFSGSLSGFGLGAGPSHCTTSDLGGGLSFSILANSSLNACLASLECSLELLADQVSDISKKLSFVELVPMVPSSGALLLVGSVLLAPGLDSNMALDGELASSNHHFPSIDMSGGFSSSSSKILTTKVDGLKSKMSALKASVSSVLARLDLLCAGSGSSLLPSLQ